MAFASTDPNTVNLAILGERGALKKFASHKRLVAKIVRAAAKEPNLQLQIDALETAVRLLCLVQRVRANEKRGGKWNAETEHGT